MQAEQPTQSFDILVVDDELPIFDILARAADKVFPEARFINTRSTQETLAYIDIKADRTPQLILLDIDLRESTDGLSLLPELKARFKGRVPIIMLSHLDDEAKVEQAYAKGAVAYTQKPENMQGWHQCVQALKKYWYVIARLPTAPPSPID